MPEINEDFWRRLLRAIRNRQVVPVIGRRIGLAQRLGAGLSFQEAFEQSLEQEVQHALGVDVGTPADLLDSVGRLRLSRNVDDRLLHDHVCNAIEQAVAMLGGKLPDALVQLAEIDDFDFLVTLAPDGLLGRALRQRGKRVLLEVEHAPRLPDARRLPPDWAPRAGETSLFYLFGKADSEHFAIHEEDLVEYAHQLLRSQHAGLQRFLDELRTRDLLLIGCGFPDWLGRLLLRLMGSSRLGAAEQQVWLVDDPTVSTDFAGFLGRERPRTEIVSNMAPEPFIAELHRRWLAPPPAKDARPAAQAKPPKRPIFFVSYARAEDGGAVERLVAALREHLKTDPDEIWYDRDTLEPGQDFQREIYGAINDCECFLPIVSSASDPLEGRFFRMEWFAAAEKAKLFALRTFVVPVMVEADTRPEKLPLADRYWHGLDYGRAPGGGPEARLLAKLKKLLEEARQRRHSASP
jgi:TIR domain/SIR2-like domain